MRTICWCLIALFWTSLATAAETILLKTDLAAGDRWDATVKLQVGGDRVMIQSDGKTETEPFSVLGKLQYEEQVVRWHSDHNEPLSSVRVYDVAAAKIDTEKESQTRQLPPSAQVVFTEIVAQQVAMTGASEPLTREHFDLVNAMGNSLAVQRLLPGRALAEGESWDHDASQIGPMLGMDYVAVCEVSSVVIGMENNQVQLRMAGSVHGTIDGAPTEMELRGAYLFHRDQKRITKFNLAIKERRTASEVVPGLDVVAKITVEMVPVGDSSKITDDHLALFEQNSESLRGGLMYEANAKGYRFRHDQNWYVISERRDISSLSCLGNGEQVAFCNVATLPARSEGQLTTIKDFEIDVRESLGDKLDRVTASTQWKTPRGYECLGVIAQGLVEEVPIEWRYYLVSSPGLPRVSLALTVEQENLKQFNDADRLLIESLELFPKQKQDTASKPKVELSR